MSAEISRRLLKPSRHTLLAMCLNPSIDTTDDGELMKDKPGLQELMKAEYHSR